MGDAAGHYFDASPRSASAPKVVQLDLPDRTLRLRTDRGVFSADRVDPATKLLLLEAPDPPTEGVFLDLGCGYGPIALTLAARRPAALVWAVDVNRRALDLCRDNARSMQLANVMIGTPAEVPVDLKVDLIWSNPPIRIGKSTLHDLLRSWLERLGPSGTAVLVVHKHLGSDSLQRWLEGDGWSATRLTSRDGNRLLRVVRV